MEMDKKRTGVICLIQAILATLSFQVLKTKAKRAVSIITVLIGGEIFGYLWTRKRLKKGAETGAYKILHYNFIDHFKYCMDKTYIANCVEMDK